MQSVWEEPDPPPSPPPMGWVRGKPFLEADLFSVPKVGESISVTLPRYAVIGPPPPIVTAHGRVLAVKPAGKDHFELTVRREGRLGLSWDELCAFIGANSVAYHDFFGRVEGELVGLLPAAEIAQLRAPELKDLMTAYLMAAVKDGDFDKDVLEDLDEDDGVFVAWSTLWPGQTLSLNPVE